MTPPKQYTPAELFDMWWTDKREISELAKTYGYDPNWLSKRFNAYLNKSNKKDNKIIWQ